MTPRIRDTFYTTLPDTTLLNCYGPIEANSVTDMPLPDEPGAPVPLGHPAANFRVVIVDEGLELVPVGMPGEVYIGGEIGVAQAYWRAPGRSAKRFVPDPYGTPGSRMYRTGDLCRHRMDGVLEHLGRIDRQIKIRGLRIEPGEIESVLATHPAVADCAVIAHDTHAAASGLVFHYTAHGDTTRHGFAAGRIGEIDERYAESCVVALAELLQSPDLMLERVVNLFDDAEPHRRHPL